MYPLRAGNKQLIREMNQASVLNTIRSHGPLSRADIAALTNLSLPTISGITAALIDDGLVLEQATGSSTGGRRPVLLALNPEAGYVVGIKLTENRLIAALTNLAATVVAEHQEVLRSQQPADVVATIAAAVEHLRQGLQRPIFGAGIGLAGVIDSRAGEVRYATYLGWQDLPLRQLVEQALDLPVVLDNDVNALTAAEHWFGSGMGQENFIVVSLGRGIGMGLVLDGHLYRGSDGGAGEFGHTTVVPDGPRCECGKRGCLEALISEPAVLRRVAATTGRELTIQTALELANQGDGAVQTIFTSAGRTLGMALANIVNVLNPALIIIGGEGTRAGSLLLEPLEASLREHIFNGLDARLRIVLEPWGDDAWARGAAGLLLGELFRPGLRRGEEQRPFVLSRLNG